MTAADKAAAAWDALNTRQRAYLRCLYDLDQDAEAHERGAFAAGGRARPAAEWRWITYRHVNVGPGAPRGVMQRALDVRDRRDQGAGSTLLSPYLYARINVHGHYTFQPPDLGGGRRALRDPDAGDDD